MNAITTTVTSLSQLFLTQLPLNLIWLLLGTSLMLFPGCAPNGDISYQVNEQEERVDIFYGDELFTSLQYAEHFKKPILYPLKTARGTVVTREFLNPQLGERRGHPHQVGVWLTYGNVNGRDFWNVSNAHPPPDRYHQFGAIHHKELKSVTSDGKKVELQLTADWITLDGVKLLEESTTYVFSGSDNQRHFDRITTLTASEKDISLKDDKEGMFGMRVTHELSHPDQGEGATGIYLSSEGLTGHDVWGKRAKWVSLNGNVDGENISIVILDHPQNPGYPAYWHARGYGLFAANPLGQESLSDGKDVLDYQLRAGESVTFRYRVILYSDQELTGDVIDGEWMDFSRM